MLFFIFSENFSFWWNAFLQIPVRQTSYLHILSKEKEMLEKNESHNMFYHIIRDKVRSFRNIWISFKFLRKISIYKKSRKMNFEFSKPFNTSNLIGLQKYMERTHFARRWLVCQKIMLFDDNFLLRFGLARTFPVSEQKKPPSQVRPSFERQPEKQRVPFYSKLLIQNCIFLEWHFSLKSFEI